MPIYEYKCEDCDKVFEVIQKISEKKLTKCKCSKNGTVHRMKEIMEICCLSI